MDNGHANLRRHKILMNSKDDLTCSEFGEKEETSIQVLIRCPLHARNRWHFLGKATLKKEGEFTNFFYWPI